ncbi:unnamed protein product [Spodoptera littoralis]|uniref:MADF domain-containing protein n=1 Tax=Spodoptera littoralis TaxID=7109 RepID=A0A9P0IFG5_SPOLI|nr:unnamed protein product [Spodoptera littoralis]CAH1645750.1 unnamed protein product [Spodoptera littoralis]
MFQPGTSIFIKLVKSKPVLYDANHRDYKNVHLKNKIWEEIGEKVDMSGEFAKMKWKNLRDTYIKYLKTNQAMSTRGLETSSYNRYGKWQWASSMSFIKYHTGVLNDSTRELGAANCKDTEQESDKEEENAASTSNNIFTSNKVFYNTRKRSNCITDSPPPAQISNSLTSTEHIMVGYAKAIDNFSSKRRQILTKMKIANIIMEAELKDEQERANDVSNMIISDSDDSVDPSASKNYHLRKSRRTVGSDYSNSFSPVDSPIQMSDPKKDIEKVNLEADGPLVDVKCKIEIEDT